MANPLSNPSAPTKPAGPTTKVTRRASGSQKRDPIPASHGTTRGKAVTLTGAGTEGGTTDHILQDATTVQGQPRTGYGDGPTRGPIPNAGS